MKARGKACGRQVFIPNWGNGGVAFYVRAGLGSASAYAAVRSEVRKLDPSMPVYDLKTLAAQLDETLLTERLIALLSAGFGLLATLLATIGLYGVMAFVGGAAHKGTGAADGARRAAGFGDLAGYEGGAGAARDRPGDRHSGCRRVGQVRGITALRDQVKRSLDRGSQHGACSSWSRSRLDSCPRAGPAGSIRYWPCATSDRVLCTTAAADLTNCGRLDRPLCACPDQVHLVLLSQFLIPTRQTSHDRGPGMPGPYRNALAVLVFRHRIRCAL